MSTTTTHALVETMPTALRASHEAAGNSGSYPDNGAERRVMTIEEAEQMVEADPDWTSIVRELTEEQAVKRELRDHGYALGERVRGGASGVGEIVGVQFGDMERCSMVIIRLDSLQTVAAPWSAIEAVGDLTHVCGGTILTGGDETSPMAMSWRDAIINGVRSDEAVRRVKSLMANATRAGDEDTRTDCETWLQNAGTPSWGDSDEVVVERIVDVIESAS